LSLPDTTPRRSQRSSQPLRRTTDSPALQLGTLPYAPAGAGTVSTFVVPITTPSRFSLAEYSPESLGGLSALAPTPEPASGPSPQVLFSSPEAPPAEALFTPGSAPVDSPVWPVHTPASLYTPLVATTIPIGMSYSGVSATQTTTSSTGGRAPLPKLYDGTPGIPYFDWKAALERYLNDHSYNPLCTALEVEQYLSKVNVHINRNSSAGMWFSEEFVHPHPSGSYSGPGAPQSRSCWHPDVSRSCASHRCRVC